MKNGTSSTFERKNYDDIPKKQAKSYEIDLGQNVHFFKNHLKTKSKNQLKKPFLNCFFN